MRKNFFLYSFIMFGGRNDVETLFNNTIKKLYGSPRDGKTIFRGSEHGTKLEHYYVNKLKYSINFLL